MTSRGPVSIEKGGRILGNVTCPTLAISDGGQLVGMVVTGPRAAELLAEIEAAVPAAAAPKPASAGGASSKAAARSS